MPSWRRLIAFQISSYVLFSYLPPPFDIIGIVPFFIALGFYKAALLIFSIGIIKISVFAPHILDIFFDMLHRTYYIPWESPFPALDNFLDIRQTLYCYSSPINDNISYQTYLIFSFVFFAFVMFGSTYFEIRLIKKYIKPRLQFLLGG